MNEYTMKDQSVYIERFRLWTQAHEGDHLTPLGTWIQEFANLPNQPDSPTFITRQLEDYFYGWPYDPHGDIESDILNEERS